MTKIKIYSWILAGAYPLCGLAFFVTLFKLQKVFAGMGIQLPWVTVTTLSVGRFEWLGASVAMGALVILKDLRFQSRLLNPLFTVALVSWIICMAVALLYPFMAITCCLAEN